MTDWGSRFREARALRQPMKKLYHAYLQSPEWKVTRDWIIGLAKGKCERCQERPPTEVHHKTYQRCGNELPEDLLALCGLCHMNEHPDKMAETTVALKDWELKREAYRSARLVRQGKSYDASIGRVHKFVAMVARALPRIDNSDLRCSDEELAMRVSDHPSYTVHALYGHIETDDEHERD